MPPSLEHKETSPPVPVVAPAGDRTTGVRRVWEALLAWVVVTVAVLVWMIPKGFQATQRILGHHDSDVVKHFWNLWWFRQMVLVDGQVPYHTDYLNYPKGFLLYPIEPLNGLAVLLLGGPLGLPLAVNVLSVLNLVIAGVGMYALVRFLTGRFLPALASGLLYATSAYALWTVYVGVGELSHLGWLPLACLFRLARDGGWRNLVWATGLFFVAAIACWYYALFLYLIAGLLMITDPWRGRGTPVLWGRYLAVVAVSLGLLLPIQKAFDVSYQSTPRSKEGLVEFVSRRIDAQPHDAPPTRLDPAQLFLGGPKVRNLTIQNPYLAGRFVGISALLLGLVALAHRPGTAGRWWLVFGTATLLGFGSRLVISTVESGPRLPFAWLNLGLEWFSHPINFPARFAMPVTLAASVLAGLGLDAVGTAVSRLGARLQISRARRVAAVVVALLGTVPILEHRLRGDVPSPLPSRPVAALPAAGFLAQETERRAVIEFPQLYEDGRKSRDAILLMQVVHGWKSASLPLDRISTFVSSGRQLVRSNPLIRSLLVLNDMNGPDEALCCQDKAANDAFVMFQRQWLITRGFTRLIVTYTEMTPQHRQDVQAFCRHVFGPPIFTSDNQDVFAITERVAPGTP